MVNLGSNDDKGKVSVVVTFKNLDNVAGRMLNSLINQTYKNLEIICVNDNSTDNTLKVLNEFANSDNRIVVLSNSESCGVSKSRNLGIDRATGKYLIIVDGDDEMILDGIENMVRAFDENTDCVVAGFKQVPVDDISTMILPEQKISGSPKNAEFFETLMRYSNQSDVCCYTRMYKRETVKARYNESCNYGEQILFAFDMLKYLNNITMLPVVVYNYAPYPYPKETISNKAKGKEFELIKQIMPQIQHETKKMFPNNKYLAYIAGFYLITSIYLTAKSLQQMGKNEQEIEDVVKVCLNDDMVQELVEGLEAKTIQDESVAEIVSTKNSQAVVGEVLEAQTRNELKDEKFVSSVGKVISNLFMPSGVFS